MFQTFIRYVPAFENEQVKDVEVQRACAGGVVLQRIKGRLAVAVQRNYFAVDDRFMGIFASAVAMPGYLTVKSLSFRERRWKLPFDLMAMARYPSSFISYVAHSVMWLPRSR